MVNESLCFGLSVVQCLGQGSAISEFGVYISKVIGNVSSRNSYTTHSQNEKKVVGQVTSNTQEGAVLCYLE